MLVNGFQRVIRILRGEKTSFYFRVVDVGGGVLPSGGWGAAGAWGASLRIVTQRHLSDNLTPPTLLTPLAFDSRWKFQAKIFREWKQQSIRKPQQRKREIYIKLS